MRRIFSDCFHFETITNKTTRFLRKSIVLFLMYLLPGAFFIAQGQSPQANLDQANNGRDNAPNNPMTWVNGNLNETQNHYIEGQSIPYRAILDRFKVGCQTKIRIGFDSRNSSHMAIDYLTSYDQPGPHPTVFPGHNLPQETINPLLGLAGTFSSPATFPLPGPGTINTPVPGQAQASFNALTAAQKNMTIYNGTISNIAWVVQPDYNEANSNFEAIIEVTFTPSALPVVLSWGGHIASRLDWGIDAQGNPRSAGGIPGSPYHMRLKDWDVTGVNASSCNPVFTSIGNQDRSLQISALPCSNFIAGNILVDFSQYDNTNTIGLNVIPSGGYSPYSYSWTASAGISLSDPHIQNPTATVVGSITSATFTVLITDAIGCTVTKTITVALTPRPCDIVGPTEVCPNSDDIFSFPYGGATSLTWSVTGNGSISGTNVGTPIHVLADLVCGGQYIVTVVAVYPNETKTCSKTVTVLTPAAATFNNPPGNVTVACGNVPPISTLTYSNGGSGGCAIGGTVTATRTGSYTACGGTVTDTWTFTDLCQRTITYSRTITVQPAPFPTYTNPPGNITLSSCESTLPNPSALNYSNGGSGFCLLSGTVTSTISLTSGAAPCARVYTETWTTNVCNQPLTISRTITVPAASPATFTNPPSNITIQCGSAPPSPTLLSYSNGVAGACAISGTVTSTITGSHNSCGGTYTETWTFNDPCGRGTTTYSRTITVSAAAQAHFVSPPGNITVGCGQIPAVTCLAYTNDGSGGCLISGCVTSTQTATPPLCGGTVTETWSFTDQCGRNITVSRTITVTASVQAHFIDPPGNIEVGCGQIPAVSCLAYTNAGSGGCLISGCVTSTQTVSPGLCGGTVTETWSFTDACGRTITTSRLITVAAAAQAHFTSTPGNITVACGQIPALSCLTYTNSGSGGCLISGCVTSTQTTAPGTCGGTVTETWSFTDQCGRNITTSRTITVTAAAQAHFVSPPGNITVACGGVPAVSCLAYTNDGSGGCAISGCVTSTQTTAPGTCGGTVTETWSFTDACQRTITYSRTITVGAATQAHFTSTPGNITVACGSIPSVSCLTYTNDGSGNCLISGCVTSTQTAAPGICGGTVTETWSFTDQCGRTITTSRVITVSAATQAHFVTTPGNITVACGQIPAVSCLQYTNSATAGGCLISGCVTSTQTTPPGTCGGTVTETWSFTDQCGRNITTSRTITVSAATQAHFVNPPTNITVACGQIPAVSCLAYTNDGSGGCVISGCVTSTQTAAPPVCGGTVTETWSFTDQCGRTITTSRTITVTAATQAHFVNPPGNITVACGQIPAVSCLAYTNDGSGGCVISGCVTSTQTTAPGTCGGTVTETWSFTDACGRTINASRVITVSAASQAHFTSTPGNITVACGQIPAVSCLAYTNDGSGGCVISGCVTSTQTASPGTCGGTVTETWSFTDACGRNITTSRLITVTAATQAHFVNPPANITVGCGAIPAVSCLAYTNDGSGGCVISGCVTSTQTTPPPTCGGTITETWTFTDACQRTITYSRTITVSAAAQAHFTSTPGNITVACGQIPAVSCLTYTNDGSGGCLITGCVTSTQTTAPGTCGGTVTETWSFTDGCGRNITTSRVITVTAATQAHFTSNPANITVACGQIPAVSCLAYTNDGSGGCAISGCVTSTQTAAPPVCGGTVTETWSFTDACQRTITWFRTITVTAATQAHFVNPPTNITVACGQIPAVSCLAYTNDGSGGCVISGCVTSTQTTAPGTCGGTVTETWSFTDACGRTINASRVITVTAATQAHFVTTPGNVTVACGQIPAVSCLQYTNSGSGGCLITGCVTSTQTAAPPICGGTVTETWSFTDQCGRTITTSRTITVTAAAQAHFVNPPGNITVSCGGIPAVSCLAYTNDGSGGCVISGCVTSTQTTAPGLCGGQVTETWSFTDACGRTINASRVITVTAATQAHFTSTPGNITVACGQIPAVTCLAYTNDGSGGCAISGCVTSTQTAAPPICGGTVTETWSFTDACGRTITTSRTITVTAAAQAHFVNPPGNITVACGGIPAVTCLAYTNDGSGGCVISGCVTSTQTTAPGTCGGTVTETWSFTDACGRTINASRLITVTAATQAHFTSNPANITVACGQIPAVTCLAYTNDGSGGCAISGCVTSTQTAAPPVCGGTVTETWSFTDACQRTITWFRTITVTAATQAHFVNPPGNITVACGGIPAVSCLAYTNDGSGGCVISGCVTSTQTTAPGTCGGTVTETWSFTDPCGRNITTSRVITVTAATQAHFTSNPANITVACGAIPAVSCLAYTNDGSGGCAISGCVTSTQTATPPLCGGTVTETWSFTDACQRTITWFRTITVTAATQAHFVNPPGNITVACGGIPAVTCLQYTNSGSGGCLITGCVTSTQTTAPGTCGGTVTETWSFTDACGRNITTSRVITVTAATQAHFTSTPGNITVACGQIPAVTCLAYTNDGSGGCAISGCVTSTQTAAPPICGGTVTETWSFTDQCGRTITTSRTITVTAAAQAHFVNPPGNITVSCGGIPAVSCLAYTNDGSGGCVISGCVTSTQTTAPGLCGGTVTETWSFTDACGRTINASRVITVTAATQAHFTSTPGNITVACGQIPAVTCLAYTNEGSGGCAISGCVTSTQTAAPGLCGGTVTETWSFTDQCGRNITKTRTITVTAAAQAHFVEPPGNITVDCGSLPNPSCLAYTNAGGSGCLISGCVTSTRTATPGVCGGTVTETWSFTDQCGRNITYSRTITVSPAPMAHFTSEPQNITVSCGGIPAVSCLPYTNNATDGCLISGCITSTQTAAPGVCGGTVTETWTFADACQRTITWSRTITVLPAPQASFVNPPGNIHTEVCGVAPRPSPLSYSNGESGGCAISGTVTSVITGGSNVNCGTYTETWTFTDDCGRTITHSRNIEVPCCTYCSLTQGAYGNPGGTTCVNGVTVNQTQIMINALSSEPGQMKAMGRQDLNRYWIMRLTDVNQGNSSNIFKMLPGGGNSLVFKADNVPGVPEYSNGPSWSIAPLQAGGPKAGMIKNQLFAQALTLYFNTKYGNGGLANVALVDTFLLDQPVSCGSTSGTGVITKVGLPHSVVLYMANPANGYANTIGGLLQLANDALGGVSTGLSLDIIQTAVEAINSGFDQCKILVGTLPYGGTVPTSRVVNAPEDLKVTAFPNPYENNAFNLTINAPVTGEATIDLYTIDGVKISTLKHYVSLKSDNVVPIKVPTLYKTRLVYVVTIGTYSKRGIVLSPN